jgi:oligopeptidase A
MGFREVETLFHEFGHGLQHMLTTVDDGPAAGINKVEWDAVELPSQFMENWCYHRETLSSCSRHVDHGGSLPEELFQRIVAARSFNAAGLMLRQLHFGLIDLELHHRWDGEEDPIAVDRRIASAVLPRPPEDYDRFLYAFSHIFAGGYSAGYFSYKWAEVLSADAFAAFEEAGLDDAEATAALGRRFRDTVLSLGGSQPAAEVFRSFRGRDPSPEPLLRHHGLVGN